eukprot:CAMPEP_0117491182 /NCGR_PEP_ID=MMETSP0784-20121206/17933_1 /TAXON_ID=39447 /ORGANISM="" /LENGTH=609 /DNA_ID=CAMNT_0005285961 /DNA_START=86 /DNA_END=1915 /DNA_ORIENTATION=-
MASVQFSVETGPAFVRSSSEPDFAALLRQQNRQVGHGITQPPVVSKISALHDALDEHIDRSSSLHVEDENEGTTPPKSGTFKKIVVLLVGLVLLLVCGLMTTPLPGFGGVEEIPGTYGHLTRDHMPAQRCLGLLLLVSIYWGLEPMSPHITALLIPLLIVMLRVQRVPDFDDPGLVPGAHSPHHETNVTGKPGDALTAGEAATVTAAAFFDPVILLFLGGFTMAAALDKYGISERLALMLLTRAGKRPSRVLLVVMVFCVFLSMWVSNVAAAVLNTAVMLPLLRSLPPAGGWPKMVLLGIAYSCNIGGMATPIASPQNVIALTALKTVAPNYQVTFAGWILFAVPICACATLLCWLWLRYFFTTGLPSGIQTNMVGSQQTQGEDTSGGSESSRGDKRMGLQEWYIVGVVVVTVVMWCVFDQLESTFGNMGIVALIPVVALYGPSLLTPAEFNSTPWSVLILMGGGLALGNAVKSSGLLKVIAHGLGLLLKGQNMFVVSLTFNAFAGVLANFISSTVSAIIMLPIIAEVGLSIAHPRALVVGATIMCSGAMGLPVSSFPNANAMAARKSAHSSEPFLLTSDFSKTGFPMAIIMLVLMQTLGYGLFMLLGW